MAESRFVTEQYSAEQFVESVGAICFHIARQQVCIVRHVQSGEWLLPKGRRNAGEQHKETALREVLEETGLQCSLLPVMMSTRATSAAENEPHIDTSRTQSAVTDPFMLTCRHLGAEDGLKLIWWYVATIDNSDDSTRTCTLDAGEVEFEAHLLSHVEARERLTYRFDQEVMDNAIHIYERSRAALVG